MSIIKNDAKASSKILAILKKYNIGGLLIGVPLTLSNGTTPQAKLVNKFCSRFYDSTKISLPLAFWSEYMSTHSTRNIILDNISFNSNAKPNRNDKSVVYTAAVDDIAAAYILNDFLDKHHKLEQVKGKQAK